MQKMRRAFSRARSACTFQSTLCCADTPARSVARTLGDAAYAASPPRESVFPVVAASPPKETAFSVATSPLKELTSRFLDVKSKSDGELSPGRRLDGGRRPDGELLSPGRKKYEAVLCPCHPLCAFLVFAS